MAKRCKAIRSQGFTCFCVDHRRLSVIDCSAHARPPFLNSTWRFWDTDILDRSFGIRRDDFKYRGERPFVDTRLVIDDFRRKVAFGRWRKSAFVDIEVVPEFSGQRVTGEACTHVQVTQGERSKGYVISR